MKSYVRYLRSMTRAALVELHAHAPDIRRGCDRDETRLLSLIDARGLPFLMEDLPSFGKHLDQCLSKGLLTPSNVPGFSVHKKGSVIPRLFKGILSQVFNQDGTLDADADPVTIGLLRQVLYLSKKFTMDSRDSSKRKLVDEFFTVDNSVRPPSLNWDEDVLVTHHSRNLHLWDCLGDGDLPLFRPPATEDRESGEYFLNDADADVVQRTADYIVCHFSRFEPGEWKFKHGPGAVSDLKSSQFKFDFPNWPDKLSSVFPLEEFAFANYSEWAAWVGQTCDSRLLSKHEPPSRLIVVPKTLKAPRLIAAEPVSHQWCQQSVLDYLTKQVANGVLSRVIHFRDQSYNARAALAASHSQSHSTIDLSAASDRLSCWLVERIFRANSSLLSALHASRTRWVENTIERHRPRFHKLRKFACMGSACTFPVQSIVFATLSVASVLIARRLPVSAKNIAMAAEEVLVFGDDIVIPGDSDQVLRGILGTFGLKVNHSKSFGTGMFRESCGTDAYNGYDVSAIYVRSYPEVSKPGSILSAVETHNHFFEKGMFRVAALIRQAVPHNRFPIREVPVGSGLFGWSSFNPDLANQRLKRRWNTRLQRMEELALVPVGTRSMTPIQGGSVLLQALLEVERRTPFIRKGERLGRALRASLNLKRRWEAV